MKPIVTVFTPTYNRGYVLSNAYESLKNQTDKRFEWIIVDDGSSDNTEKLVERWIKENNNFKISYYYQENSGKHIAINCGVAHAAGKLFFILDSDDYLRADAIGLIIKYSTEIKSKLNYGGIVFNRAYINKKIIGSTFFGKIKDITFFERERYGITGDKAEIIYTETLRKYPFPKFKSEKFCTEAIVWNRMATDKILFRFINENIYFTEYLDDGLSKKYQILMERNPCQSYVFFKESYKNNSYMTYKMRILYLINLVYFAVKSNHKNDIKKEFGFNKLFTIIIYFVGKFYRILKY